MSQVTTQTTGNTIIITCKPGYTGPQWKQALRDADIQGREVSDFTFEILDDETEIFTVYLQPELALVK